MNNCTDMLHDAPESDPPPRKKPKGEESDRLLSELGNDFGFTPRLLDADYRLFRFFGGASGLRSIAFYQPGAIPPVDRDAFEALWRVKEAVPPTPNPMNPKYNLLRTQATFGTTYDFAGQRSQKLGGDDPSTWPKPIIDMLDVAKGMLEGQQFAGHPLAAHVNCYPGGKAGVEPHDDKEDVFVPGAPIFSFTLYRSGCDDEEHVPRKFQIYLKDPAAKRRVGNLVHDIPLPHESLLIMAGAMQRDFLHGVKKTSSKKYERSRRINVTVRVLRA